jgi:hypothetical protein
MDWKGPIPPRAAVARCRDGRSGGVGVRTGGAGGAGGVLTRRQLLQGVAAAAATAALGGLPSLLRVPPAAAAPPHLPPSSYPSTVATDWFHLLGELVRTTGGFSPPVASRAFAYAGVTVYEAVVAGSPDHRSLVGQLNNLQALPRPHGGPYHWGAATNAALGAVARGLWPTAPGASRAAVTTLEARYDAEFAGEAPRGVWQRSVRFGRQLAAAVLDWAASDGGHEGFMHDNPADYTPPQGPGLWVPTPPGFLPALKPRWGDNRPFCLTSPTACTPGSPTPYAADPASGWHAEALEVYAAVKDLTDEQRAIALFWADDPGTTATPPGHSVAIATQVLHARQADLATAAETYAKVGIAVADAFIACWHAKYVFNLVRPITYLQAHVDPAWGGPQKPLPVVTPPFPEYPSGHSVQSAATAEVLTDLFGDDFAFTDSTHQDRCLPARSFPSFHAAAEEAAISRLYGGIHFRPAIVDGLAQGRCIGQAVNRLELHTSSKASDPLHSGSDRAWTLDRA